MAPQLDAGYPVDVSDLIAAAAAERGYGVLHLDARYDTLTRVMGFVSVVWIASDRALSLGRRRRRRAPSVRRYLSRSCERAGRVGRSRDAGTSTRESSHEHQRESSGNGAFRAAREPQASGSPTYVRPTALVVLREDHEFMRDALIPMPGQPFGDFDFVLASQPWRATMSAKLRCEKVMTPLARSLALGGQSYGVDPALENELGSGT